MWVAKEGPGSVGVVGGDADRGLALSNDQAGGLGEVDGIAVGGEAIQRYVDRRLGHVPDVCQDVAHLALQITGGLDGGPAGGEGGAAAGSVAALRDGVGVGNAGMDPVGADAEGPQPCCMAMDVRVPPISGEDSRRVTEPSPFESGGGG